MRVRMRMGVPRSSGMRVGRKSWGIDRRASETGLGRNTGCGGRAVGYRHTMGATTAGMVRDGGTADGQGQGGTQTGRVVFQRRRRRRVAVVVRGKVECVRVHGSVW